MDLTLFQLLHSLAGRSGVVDGFIIFFADYLPYVMLVGLIVFLFRGHRGFRDVVYRFVFFALSVLLAKGVIVEVIRFFYDRARPFVALDIVPLLTNMSPAFPSGHASFMFALAFGVLCFNRVWGYVFLGAAVLNGLARVSAGLHWPTDILGGILVAGLSFGLVYVLLRPYRT